MMKKLLLAISMLALATISNANTTGGGSGSYHENSAKVCNCTETEMKADLCQTQSVSVTVGGGTVVSVTAGLSTTTCIKDVAVPPGKCAYAVYNFTCESGFWGWDCVYTSWSLQPLVKATTTDCPTPSDG